MKHAISEMLETYERGRVSRRQLIESLVALAGTAYAPPAHGSTFQGVGINHIALRVTDVQRARDFYQRHFGLPVVRESQSNSFLGLGKNFLALFRNANPGLDHHCIAIENFEADSVMEELYRQGLNPHRPSGSNRVYFPDPDGLVVQVSSLDHHA